MVGGGDTAARGEQGALLAASLIASEMVRHKSLPNGKREERKTLGIVHTCRKNLSKAVWFPLCGFFFCFSFRCAYDRTFVALLKENDWFPFPGSCEMKRGQERIR